MVMLPLFAWPKGTYMREEGVRYVDMVALIKRAARYCGLEEEFYSSHSQRRGGASGYLLSGGSTRVWSLAISVFIEAVY